MRSIPRFSCRWLAVSLLLGSATADDAWVDVGELHFPQPGRVGKLSVNIESLRRRPRHYEIWERVTFGAEASGPLAADAALSERLTLWAIRCRQGAMAKVTERVGGAFLPRRESLRFAVPSPDGSGAAVIDVACAEARRRFADDRTGQGPESPLGPAAAPVPLNHPPSMADDDQDDGDD